MLRCVSDSSCSVPFSRRASIGIVKVDSHVRARKDSTSYEVRKVTIQVKSQSPTEGPFQDTKDVNLRIELEPITAVKAEDVHITVPAMASQ